jgi:RP/EB family microtubule-associated protein
MTKVKFNARADYEYLENFKILQGAFKKHSIDKVGSRSFPIHD